jgi:hypothetical protein
MADLARDGVDQRCRIRIWLPLVDALRTCLFAPASELREILEHARLMDQPARMGASATSCEAGP